MRVSVTKRDFQRALARCQGVADKKGTMPVLGNVLLNTTDSGDLTLAATDLFLSVRGSVSAQIEQPGSVALGARDLYERVRMMPEGEISIETREGALTTLRAKGSPRRYTLRGLPGSEFPQIADAPVDADQVTLPAATLGELIARTAFSISTDDTRPHLNSALFEWDRGLVRMVTTDGHRLSKIEIKTDHNHPKASMLIPLKAIHELKRLCDEAKAESRGEQAAELVISQSGINAFFSVLGFTFSVKLVDAQFPPYEQVIPQASDYVGRAPRSAVVDALKAVSLAASERTGGVKMSLTKDCMRLSSESPESGDGFDEVIVEYDGRDVTIGFNARYLVDVLAAVESDNLEFNISGDLDPVVLRPVESPPGTSYLAVVMPMRI